MSDPASTPDSSGAVAQPPAVPQRRRRCQCGADRRGWGPVHGSKTNGARLNRSKVLGGPLRPYGERARFEESVRSGQPVV